MRQNRSPKRPSSGHKGLAYGVLLRFRVKTWVKILFGRTSAVAVLASFCGINLSKRGAVVVVVVTFLVIGMGELRGIVVAPVV